MNKVRLTRFIQKYSLGGLVESVAWKAGDNKLVTRFISDDKTVLGEIELENSKFTAPDLGVYTTSLLNKLLTTVDEDVELEVQEVGGKAINLILKSGAVQSQFQLADLAVIPNVPDLKKLPDFDIEINFDGGFIDKFIKAKNALSDVDTFTIVSEKKELKLVLGYSNVNSNRVTFIVDKAFNNEVKPISFSAKYLKEILTANKDATSALLKVSTQGLSHIQFKVDDFTAKYYLVEQQLSA
jgi:stage V sporulation protein SpoVS